MRHTLEDEMTQAKRVNRASPTEKQHAEGLNAKQPDNCNLQGIIYDG